MRTIELESVDSESGGEFLDYRAVKATLLDELEEDVRARRVSILYVSDPHNVRVFQISPQFIYQQRGRSLQTRQTPLIVEMSADKNKVGTELPRAPSRHAASYAEGPRFVRGRENAAAAADRNQLAAQARVEQLFDRVTAC